MAQPRQRQACKCTVCAKAQTCHRHHHMLENWRGTHSTQVCVCWIYIKDYQSSPSVSSPWTPIPPFTQDTHCPLGSLCSHPSLVRHKTPVRVGGGVCLWQGPGLCPPSMDAFQNCCLWPDRIQEIVVETPALVAERER